MTRHQRRKPWRAGASIRRWAVAGCLVLGWGMQAAAQGVKVVNSALDCSFTSADVGPWRMVTALTSGTPRGSILYKRFVSLMINFKYGSANSAHELVAAAHWAPGMSVPNGIARTDVDGIGIKWVGVASDGTERTLLQHGSPTATWKVEVIDPQPGTIQKDDTRMAHFVQYLVLEKEVSQLPPGKLIIRDLPGNPAMHIYALDLPKGTASLGSIVMMPEHPFPPNLCNVRQTYVGVANVCLGGNCEITVPNRCRVDSDTIKSVSLGRFAISDFPSLRSTSKAVDFGIELSECAAAAKPAISFRDKAAQPNPDNTLLQLSAPAGQPVARGFNIMMTHGITGERIAFGEPGKAPAYPMQRSGSMANIPLRAQYIRTGVDGELAPGNAGGAAEFSFTFP